MSRSMIKEMVRKSHVMWLRLRATRLADMPPQRRVLIVAPHPDDEVIGCGGLISRMVATRCTPHIVILTGGDGSHRDCCSIPASEIVKARRELTRKSLSILGVPSEFVHELDFMDGSVSSNNSRQIERLKTIMADVKPDVVFVPHWGEGWNDHVRTAEIVKTLVAPDVALVEYCVWMWYYNVWRGLDWKNAFRVDLTPEEHALKLRAIEAYVRPKAPCGRPWSGVLPKIFIDANKGRRELYFKVR